jgi:TRAP-type C4-dicarboxylate transport system permease small subunit
MTLPGDPSDDRGRRLSFELVAMNVGFVVLVGSIVWGVLSRYVTESPATWVEEVSSIAFTWVVFVGAAEVHRRGRHVRVDLLTSLLPARIRPAQDAAVEIFVALYCFYVAWLGLQQTIASNSATTSMLGIPLSVPYAGLTLGFLLMALRSVQQLLRRRRRG